ncbi:MAG: lysophospholipid acyltransferase family protein [Salinivirgaceae bacterium]|nr:lysophospholipid acyltransferase family protein [Salinivirgaceae bacterium]
MNKVIFVFFYLGINLFRIIPFYILYKIGYVFYVIIYYLVGYRKSVVADNLSKCFSDKTIKEIKKLCKAFYKYNLSDIFVEGLKGFTMSQKQFHMRYKLLNPEILDEYYENNQDVIAVASHYGNWEWGIQAVNGQLKHQAAALYKPLSNKLIENYTKKLRENSGMKLVSIYDTKEYFQSKKDKPVVYIMAADQFPGGMMKKAIWVDFLGRETPCLHGPESYARFNNLPLIFFDVKRVKRGFYEMEIVKLVDHPEKEDLGQITAKYMHILEKTIMEKPENWLWTHKRWKVTKRDVIHSS